MIWIITFIVIVMLASALAVLFVDNLLTAVIATSLVSLLLSVLFVLLRAPDVAMTEAVVGSGLSTVILALALRRLGHRENIRGGHDA